MGIGKRKREILPEEVEVDINAPEPPSKKELRRAKKGKPMNHKPANSDDEADPALKAARKAERKNRAAHRELDQALQAEDAARGSGSGEESGADDDEGDDDDVEASDAAGAGKAGDAEKRDAPGVWVGNLPWTVTKADLLRFVAEQGKVMPSEVTRVHMPGPTAAASAQSKFKKLSNRGFAYLDFKTEAARDAVIGVSESLLAGRAVLIKNSKSYEGRPKPEDRKVTDSNGKPPSTRIFVGNLSFDTTEDDLRDHYAKCGQVKSVFVATFQDSGNCKGFAWVTFEEVVSADKAIRGWVELVPEEEPEEEEEKEKKSKDDERGAADDEAEGEKTGSRPQKEGRKKKAKPRKWFVNRMKGRELRMEFAEDATTRYIKRYGKPKTDVPVPSAGADTTPPDGYAVEKEQRKTRHDFANKPRRDDRAKTTADTEPRPRRKPQPVAPKLEQSKDKAYLTGALMEGKGKKIVF